ncbi:hypothetical protein SV7mr_06020 [Stieleria bergensis]|uniref:Uncharacterized protein n=1 Tax=Stieleria bergensis TaxID=2528025 RepID=A0A517SPR0_9BACT|nr:hypothetical protein SV7mr_06020 [Planctomycetes bacterium SV_7m_r]
MKQQQRHGPDIVVRFNAKVAPGAAAACRLQPPGFITAEQASVRREPSPDGSQVQTGAKSRREPSPDAASTGPRRLASPDWQIGTNALAADKISSSDEQELPSTAAVDRV